MREREDANRTREAGNRDKVVGVVANTLNSFRNGASLLANTFGVGFVDWLGIWCDCLLARGLGRVMVGNQPPATLLLYPDPGKASVTENSLAFVLPIHY